MVCDLNAWWASVKRPQRWFMHDLWVTKLQFEGRCGEAGLTNFTACL